jgi:hypothetical protein
MDYRSALGKAVQNNTVEYFEQNLSEKLEGEYLHGFYNHNDCSVRLEFNVIDIYDNEYMYSVVLNSKSFTPFGLCLLENPKIKYFEAPNNITAKCSINLDERKKYLEKLVKNKMDFGYFDYKYALSFNLHDLIKEYSDDYAFTVNGGDVNFMACFNSEKRLNDFVKSQKKYIITTEEIQRKYIEMFDFKKTSNKYCKNEYQEKLEKEISSLRDLVIELKKPNNSILNYDIATNYIEDMIK